MSPTKAIRRDASHDLLVISPLFENLNLLKFENIVFMTNSLFMY